MDEFSLNFNDEYSIERGDEFPIKNQEEISEQVDTHAFLEMRVAELWKKLEETNENLNSCDTILETYCKVVSEKLNQKICSKCQRQCLSDDDVEKPNEIVDSEVQYPPPALMEKLAKSFQNLQHYFYIMDEKAISVENMKFQPSSLQSCNGTSDTLNKFYTLLREVFDKMMLLEACLEQLQQERHYEPAEKANRESGTDDILKEMGVVTTLSGDVFGKEDCNREGMAMELKSEETLMHADVAFILSSVAICIATAEERSNEKQFKREIFSADPGYSFGRPPHGFGFGGFGHHGLDLGFGHGFGYGAPLARVAVAPVARTLAHAPTIHFTHVISAPIHAPTLSLAAPLPAHVPAEPLKPIIAAPIASVVPAPFGLPYPTAVLAHKIPATVHITEPITAHITPVLSAPITTVKLEIPKYEIPKLTHTLVKPSVHHRNW